MRYVRFVLLAGFVAALTVVLGLFDPSVQAGTTSPGDSQEQVKAQLAQWYSPILVIRKHTQQCGDGEPYLPISVDAVLGRRDVVLRTPHGNIAGPTVAQLSKAGADSYLDLPGKALTPGCDYEKWYDQIKKGTTPTIYARVVADAGHVVVQYWFYYVYNDWNDRHESDWEMLQIIFPVANPAEALKVEPTSTAYAQHEGSEVAAWSDTGKLHRVDGTHPVVYPGQGSHASYYTQATWLGRGAATGFGCDDTGPVGTEVHPAVTLLPTQVPTDPGDRFAWLAFTGHWGEKAPSFNNGPTGPATKTQWSTPVAWVEQQGRPGSVALPAVATMATKGFCGMVRQGSTLFLRILAQPVLVAAAILAVVALLVFLIRRTCWRDGDPAVVDRERTVGQILVDMFAIAYPMTPALLPVGAVLFAATYLARSIHRLGLVIGPQGTIVDLQPGLNGWWAVAVTLCAAAVLAVIDAVCAAVVLELVQQVGAGRRANLRAAVRNVRGHRTPVYVFLTAVALIALTLSTFWLFPVALALLALWSVSMAAAGVEDRPLRSAFRRSATLVRLHPAKSAVVALLLLVTAAGIGPFVGGLLLLVTGWPIAVEDLIGGVLTAFTIPAAVIGLGLLFFDLRRAEAVAQRGEPGLP